MIIQYAISTSRSNPLILAIALFMLIFASFIHLAPSFAFDKNKRARQFGIGIKNRTVMPPWLVAIILAILCYLLVIFISNLES